MVCRYCHFPTFYYVLYYGNTSGYLCCSIHMYIRVCLLQADVILAVTCAIRENAERKIWSRLDYFRSLKRKRSRHRPPLKVGLLGIYCH